MTTDLIKPIDCFSSFNDGDEKEQIGYVSSIFTQVSLPYRSLSKDCRDYIKQGRNVSLTLTSGFLQNERGISELQQLPFGVKPRLFLIHIFSSCVIHRTNEVELSSTLSELLKTLSITPSYGKNGSIPAFYSQLKRLVATHFTIGISYKKHSKTIFHQPFSEIELWYDKKDQQTSFYKNKVTLSLDFYNYLIAHAIPLDLKIVRQLSQSARQLDIYTYLTSRLLDIPRDRSVLLRWPVVLEQFSNLGHRANLKSFKQKFLHDLRVVQKLYPCKLDVTPYGLIMFYSPPSVKQISKSNR